MRIKPCDNGLPTGVSLSEPLTAGSAFYHKYLRLLRFYEKQYKSTCVFFPPIIIWQQADTYSDLTFLYHSLMIMQKVFKEFFFQGSAFSTTNPVPMLLALDNYMKV